MQDSYNECKGRWNADNEYFVKPLSAAGRSRRLSRKAARPEGAGYVEESEAGIAAGQDWIQRIAWSGRLRRGQWGRPLYIQSLSLTNLLPSPALTHRLNM